MIESSSPAGPTRPRDSSVVLARTLGFTAAGLAFATSVGVILVGGVIIGLGCQGCSGSDGDWLTNGLVLTFFVAIAGFVGVLVAGGCARLLAGVEVAGAVAMIVAIAFVALDGGDMHLDDSRLDASFLYWVFALIAILFVVGASSAASNIAAGTGYSGALSPQRPVEPIASALRGQDHVTPVRPSPRPGSGAAMIDDRLREARSLIAQGSLPEGLSMLREARRIAVAQGYADRMPEIAELAQVISTRTTGRLQRQSDRFARQAAPPPA